MAKGGNTKSSGRKKVTNKSAKCLLFLLLSSVWLPINYLGYATHLKHGSTDQSQQPPTKDQDGHARHDEQTAEVGRDVWQYNKSPPFLIWMSVNIIVATGLLLFILHFLNDQGPSRECLVLYLYKDLVMIILALIWINSSTAMASHLGGDDAGFLTRRMALFISHGLLAASLLLILYVNLLGYVRLVIATEKVLDPIILGQDSGEEASCKKVRLVPWVVVAVITALLWSQNIYPHHFFALTGSNESFLNLPLGTQFVAWMHPVLGTSGGILLMLARRCGHQGMANDDKSRDASQPNISTTTDQMGNHNSADYPQEHQKKSSVLRWFPHLIALACLFGFSIFAVTVEQKGSIWWFCQLLNSLIGVVLPAALILTNEKLSSYGKRKFFSPNTDTGTSNFTRSSRVCPSP